MASLYSDILNSADFVIHCLLSAVVKYAVFYDPRIHDLTIPHTVIAGDAANGAEAEEGGYPE